MSIRAMIRIYCIQKTNRLGIPPNKVNKPSAYTPDIMHVKRSPRRMAGSKISE